MTRQNTLLDPKDVSEVDVVVFDFTSMLSVGEAIVGATITSDLYAGVDPAANLVVNSSPQFTNTMVLVQIKAGIAGCEYLIRVIIATATRTLTMSALLPVIRI